MTLMYTLCYVNFSHGHMMVGPKQKPNLSYKTQSISHKHLLHTILSTAIHSYQYTSQYPQQHSAYQPSSHDHSFPSSDLDFVTTYKQRLQFFQDLNQLDIIQSFSQLQNQHY